MLQLTFRTYVPEGTGHGVFGKFIYVEINDDYFD